MIKLEKVIWKNSNIKCIDSIEYNNLLKISINKYHNIYLNLFDDRLI